MLADERTLDALDFDAVRERVVGSTATERGRATARTFAPDVHFDAVRREQRLTSDLRLLVESHDFFIEAAVDPRALLDRAAVGSTLSAIEARGVGDALAAAAGAYRRARAIESDAIGALCARYVALDDVRREIHEAVDERGTVLDRASPALARLRKNLVQAQADARDRVTALVRSGKHARAIQDAVVTIRDGRFVVPIKAEFSGEFPGIVIDTSSSGQTLFVEPLAALDANNRVRTLRLEEEHEIARILEALSRRIGARASEIDADVEVLAQLDLRCARARVAREMRAIEPELRDEPEIRIADGRHPLLGDRAVPQSLVLDDATRLIVISGPNMGGKTVALKMLGLFVTMTYCGMQIPAQPGSAIGCFTHLFADIGDEQSIADNASTFSAHLVRMREALEAPDRRTLVLVDEIGGGTEPTAGAALAIAMLERLLAASARGVVTTHATELKLFAHAAPHVANASVRFDPQTFRPTYHLDVGAPGQSLAFPLARALGIDAGIVERAEALLESRERDYESALAEVASLGAQLQRERDEAARERRIAQRERQSIEQERVRFDEERRSFAERADDRLRSALREFSTELQRRAEGRRAAGKVTAAQSALLGQVAQEMRRDLGIIEPSVPAQTAAIAPGDRVRIRSLRQDGIALEDYGESILVAIGPMKTVVAKTDVERSGPQSPPLRAARDGSAAKLAASARIASELDVRGKRYVEAEPLVEKWIDDAVLAGVSTLRLIHGKGTGQLGRGLQEYLQSHPSVESVRYGSEGEGAGGVTIVVLRGGE